MRMVVAADAIDADALVQTPRPSVFEHLPDLGELLGGTGKAKLVWASIRAGRDPWTDETVTEKARKKLKENFQEIPRVSHVTRASCGTIKLLIAMQDGMEIESVVIPHEGRPTAASVVEPRTTLCVSSQVGCNRACSFCATGKMGFIRQLTSHEILSQVYIALRCIKEENLPPLHNIVFMGMGEPLNNFVNVKKACEVLTDQNCFQMAKNRVTVSRQVETCSSPLLTFLSSQRWPFTCRHPGLLLSLSACPQLTRRRAGGCWDPCDARMVGACSR